MATGLDYLSVDENWQSFEAELNGAIMGTYDLKTDRVRFDSTSASAYVTPEGMSRLVTVKTIDRIYRN